MSLLKTLPFLALIAFSTISMAGEHTAPDTIKGTTFVSNEEAKALHDKGVFFVDSRGDAAYDESHIAGAIHLDVKGPGFTQEALSAEVGSDEKVVMYCNGVKCTRSGLAAEKAVSWGYKHVYYYREGFPGWTQNEYPTE